MINLEYSGYSLFRIMSHQERKDYIDPSGDPNSTKWTKFNLINKFSEVCKKIYDKTYTFQLSYSNDYLKNSHPYNSIDRISQDLIIRQLTGTIGKIYSARQSNRHAIVKFLKDYLVTHSSIKNHSVFILRLDIRRFYPSLNKASIINQLRESSLLSSESIWLLEEILKKSSRGIPLGVGVSAPLSEYAMELFDKSILQKAGIWYYNRYVDDIVIICSDKNTADQLWKEIPSKLGKIGLELNHKKSQKIIFTKNTVPSGYGANQMTYLGYLFKFENNKLSVLISENKIKEIKRRIVASLYSWTNHQDFNLLCDRLRFLTGHSRFLNIKDSIPTLCGLRHNYPHITNDGTTVLTELDSFMKKLIYSKNATIGASFSVPQRKELSRFSFSKGYESRKWETFSVKRISQIKRIW